MEERGTGALPRTVPHSDLKTVCVRGRCVGQRARRALVSALAHQFWYYSLSKKMHELAKSSLMEEASACFNRSSKVFPYTLYYYHLLLGPSVLTSRFEARIHK